MLWMSSSAVSLRLRAWPYCAKAEGSNIAACSFLLAWTPARRSESRSSAPSRCPGCAVPKALLSERGCGCANPWVIAKGGVRQAACGQRYKRRYATLGRIMRQMQAGNVVLEPVLARFSGNVMVSIRQCYGVSHKYRCAVHAYHEDREHPENHGNGAKRGGNPERRRVENRTAR